MFDIYPNNIQQCRTSILQKCMNQEFNDSIILKTVLKKRKMTQDDLAKLIGMGRTKLSMALSLPVLPADFKEQVIEALGLPADTFPPISKQFKQSDLETLIPDLLSKVDLILVTQERILHLLEAKS